MRIDSRRTALVVLLAAAAGCTSLPTRDNEGRLTELPTFSIVELGLANGTTSQAYGINAGGTAVGYATDAGGAQRAVVFQGGVAVRLPEPDSTTRSNAYGINDAGQIAGSVRINGVEKPVRWASATAQPTMLPLRAGTTSGRARAINNGGTIAGFVTGDELPVLWDANDALVEVDATLTESYEPIVINDDGLFAGNREDAEMGYRWDEESGFVFVGGLAGGDDDDADAAGESDVTGMNNGGVVVGSSETGDELTRAFRYTEARGIVQLGEPVAGDTGVIANAINDAGLVAGNSFQVDGTGATVASQPAVTLATQPTLQFVALPTLGGARAEPTSGRTVNPCGVIVGWAFPNGSTSRHAVAWVPAGCTVN